MGGNAKPSDFISPLVALMSILIVTRNQAIDRESRRPQFVIESNSSSFFQSHNLSSKLNFSINLLNSGQNSASFVKIRYLIWDLNFNKVHEFETSHSNSVPNKSFIPLNTDYFDFANLEGKGFISIHLVYLDRHLNMEFSDLLAYKVDLSGIININHLNPPPQEFLNCTMDDYLKFDAVD